MYFELKENRPHGTPENPFSQYHISDVKRAFQIPVHWHDELEIIYVKQGKLHVTISGENYIGSPKDAFVVSPEVAMTVMATTNSSILTATRAAHGM